MKTCEHCGQPTQGGAEFNPMAKAGAAPEGEFGDEDAESAVLEELIALMGAQSAKGLKKAPLDEEIV